MFTKILVSAVAFLGFAGTTFAGPVFNFDGAENNIFFNDRGVVLRPNANASYGGLNGYELVLVDANNLPQVGDIEIEIFQAQNIEAPLGNETWLQAANDRFQGYGVFEVTNIGVDGAGILQVEFGAASVDPFGILDTANDEILALFVDDGVGATGWDPNAATLGGAIGSVTDGDLWATFGFSGPQGSDGYLYQRNDSAGGNPQVGTGYAGFNVIRQPLLPGVVFTGVNDPDEDIFGGTTLINDIYAEQRFNLNTSFTQGNSLFQFQSNDPLVFAAVPEPSSIILFGALFGGLAGYATLRRKKQA